MLNLHALFSGVLVLVSRGIRLFDALYRAVSTENLRTIPAGAFSWAAALDRDCQIQRIAERLKDGRRRRLTASADSIRTRNAEKRITHPATVFRLNMSAKHI